MLDYYIIAIINSNVKLLSFSLPETTVANSYNFGGNMSNHNLLVLFSVVKFLMLYHSHIFLYKYYQYMKFYLDSL